MEKYILNETPVKTSVNYGINDITYIIDKPIIGKFDNITIYSSDANKVIIEECNPEMVSTKIGLDLQGNKLIKINVKANEKIEESIVIEFDFDDENKTLVDDIRIVMEENSEAKFILKYNSAEDETFFHSLKQITELKENSKATIIIANLLEKSEGTYIAVENEVEENAELNHIIIDLGAKHAASNYYSNLNGYASTNNLSSIYLGNNDEVNDINYLINLYGKKSNCSIVSQGALDGNAKKNFKGTIDFKQGSTKAKGTEIENCLLLSDKAKSKSLPMLLCSEDDVIGEHGVSTGKPSKQKLFYLMSKGISYEDAKRLIVKANFAEVLNKIEDEKLQEEIMNLIEKKV